MSTKIEWTRGDDGTPGTTWNPVTGCTKVSPGCKHCYAETIAERFWAKQYPPVPSGRVLDFRARRFTDVQTHADRLDQPLRWRSPKRVFVNSMSDLFHEDVPLEFIGRVFDVMEKAAHHTFQVLTKRPERMRDFMTVVVQRAAPPNVWLGVSCENQETADERIPLLLQTPAAVRFLSVEPLLAPVDLRNIAPFDDFHTDALDTPDPSCRVHWVIVGGESGPGARPMDLAWARSIVEQCRATGTACFVKQLGTRPYFILKQEERRGMIAPLRDRKGGDMAEFPEDLRVREFPQ